MPVPRTVAEEVEWRTCYWQRHVSIDELTWLIQAGIEAQAGPFMCEIVTSKAILDWLNATPAGQRWLTRFMEYPQPVSPVTLGHAMGRAGFPVRHDVVHHSRWTPPDDFTIYVLRRSEHWLNATWPEVRAELERSQQIKKYPRYYTATC